MSATAPPGPRLHPLLQTAGFIFFGARFLEAMRRRYGDAVTLRTVFDERFVMVFDPELVKQVFQGSTARLHAGEANALLGPILGQRSVLLLDGAEHLRHRRLMLPSFHGRQMLAHAETMRDCADAEIDSWPVGEPFTMLETMQSLTLRIILRAVFGYTPGPAQDELRARLRAMVDPLARRRALMMVSALVRGQGDRRAAREFRARKQAVDEILLAEIARRRAEPDLEKRDDVFSALLLSRDEAGNGLSDDEVRDELLTLLLAGHETTATGLAWTFDLLLHDARVMQRAAERDEALPGRGRQGVAAPAPGDRRRGPGREGGAVRAQRLRGPGRARDQSLDPHHPPARRPVPRPGTLRPERFLRTGGRAGHLHLVALRRGQPALPGRELRAHGDAHRADRVLERCALAAVDALPASQNPPPPRGARVCALGLSAG